MATVHFVKNGKRSNGECITKSVDILASAAAERLGRFDCHYAETPPTINPEVQASDWAEYEHVVLEIKQSESAPPFTKPGYYYIAGLTPAEGQHLLDISAPLV